MFVCIPRRHSTSNSWHQGPTVEMPLYIHMNVCYDSWHAGRKSVHLSSEVVWSVRCQDKIWGSWFICTYLRFTLFNLRHQIICSAPHLPFPLHQQHVQAIDIFYRAVLHRSSSIRAKHQVVPCKKKSHQIERLSFSACGQRLWKMADNQRKWSTFNPKLMMLGRRLSHVKQTLCGLEQKVLS